MDSSEDSDNLDVGLKDSVPREESMHELLMMIQNCSSSTYLFEKFVLLSKCVVERITKYYTANKKEVTHTRKIRILTECIDRMSINEILTPLADSDLNTRLSKLKELSDKVALLRNAIDSVADSFGEDLQTSVACEHFHNRVQESISIVESELRGYLNSDLDAKWYDNYACNVYSKIDCILEEIEDGEHDRYIYRYKFKINRMANYKNDPATILTIQKLINMKQFNFGRYISAKSSSIMKSGITKRNLLKLKLKIENTSVHYLKTLLKYDESRFLENKEKLNEVIDKFLVAFFDIRDKEKFIPIHDIEYTFYFIELFISVVNRVAASSNTENNFIGWFQELQIKVKELLKVVNLIKFSELTIPTTINLHVITRIIQLMTNLIRYRKIHLLEGLYGEDYFLNCNKLLIKIAVQLHNNDKSLKPFYEGNKSKVKYKSLEVKLPKQPKIKVNKISEESASKWLEKLQSVDIKAVKGESCLMCGETYAEDADLVLFLNCNNVICFKCAHHWFRVCDVKKKAYHCMYCFAEVEEYVRLSKVDQIKKMLSEKLNQ